MHYDLVIIGGGLVGTGLALALRQSGLRIALVDARQPSQDDVRLFALNHSTCQYLENVGVWTALSAYASPIHQVHVSRQGYFGAVRLNCEEAQVPALGYVIPAKYVEQALNDAVTDCEHCTFYRPATLKQLTQTDTHAELCVTTETGDITLQASIVIGADGAESTVRKQLNIPATVHDYHQSAIVFKTTLQRDHKHIAYERFVEQGAIAMLPLPDQQCASIWSAEKARADILMALSDEAFLQTIQNEFGYRLGRLQTIGKRNQFPLRMLRVETAAIGRVLLIGNALHALHPIAAQGFNLAMQEVAVLVDAINLHMQQQKPLSALNLSDIGELTRKHRERSINVSHRLSTVFNHPSVWMSALLQMGMIGFDVITPIKQTFINGMMGRAGTVPSLLLRANEL